MVSRWTACGRYPAVCPFTEAAQIESATIQLADVFREADAKLREASASEVHRTPGYAMPSDFAHCASICETVRSQNDDRRRAKSQNGSGRGGQLLQHARWNANGRREER